LQDLARSYHLLGLTKNTCKNRILGNYLRMIDEHSKIVISAVSGTGKTSLARKYADKNKNKYIVRWILSDTQDKIKEGYHKICKEIGKRPEELFGNNSIEFVNEYIASREEDDNKFLFIFDNVEKFDDIKLYIDNLQSDKVKIIITSKNSLETLGKSLM
jgi:Cdc6-like AAA superfamily ATPase